MPKNASPQRFDAERAAAYDDRIRRLAPGYDLLQSTVASVLAARLPDDAHLLVVGAGTGAEIVTMGRNVSRWQFTAVDPSPDMLDRCRSRVAEAGLAPGSSTSAIGLRTHRFHGASTPPRRSSLPTLSTATRRSSGTSTPSPGGSALTRPLCGPTSTARRPTRRIALSGPPGGSRPAPGWRQMRPHGPSNASTRASRSSARRRYTKSSPTRASPHPYHSTSISCGAHG